MSDDDDGITFEINTNYGVSSLSDDSVILDNAESYRTGVPSYAGIEDWVSINQTTGVVTVVVCNRQASGHDSKRLTPSKLRDGISRYTMQVKFSLSVYLTDSKESILTFVENKCFENNA